MEIFVQKERLHFKINAHDDQKILWPILGRSQDSENILFLAEGEGLRIPTSDRFWNNELAAQEYDTQGSKMAAPFWGYVFPHFTFNVIVHTDLRNTFRFESDSGRLFNTLTHAYEKDEKHFEISFAIGKRHDLEPAWNYKRYLQEIGHYKTLAQKIETHPEIAKLKGAVHMYVWGDGRTQEFLEDLQKLGIKSAFIGYLEKPPHPYTEKWVKKQYYVDKAYVRIAKAKGYLIGPYDSFHTMMAPKQADCANTDFGDVFPHYCIRTQNQKVKPGYKGRGCYASSEALLQDALKGNVLHKRIQKFSANGVNAYFLDCDAMGEFFDDYTPDHPMTQAKDRENRLQRMTYLAKEQGLVLGSETAASWAMEVLAFTHGAFSVHNTIHYPWMSDRENYGGWWPPERPQIFFKKQQAPKKYMKGRYSPVSRIPLYQAAFHECIVTTDRWEIPHQKFENCWKEREILELLYGVPSIWAFDRRELQTHGASLKKLFEFFHPLHKRIATLSLTDFRVLTPDQLVQSTVWEDQVELVANFTEEFYEGIPPYGLKMIDLQSGEEKLYQSYGECQE